MHTIQHNDGEQNIRGGYGMHQHSLIKGDLKPFMNTLHAGTDLPKGQTSPYRIRAISKDGHRGMVVPSGGVAQCIPYNTMMGSKTSEGNARCTGDPVHHRASDIRCLG